MKLLFQAPSLGAPHHLPTWCALLAPKQAVRFQSPLKVLLLPPANYNPINPTYALVTSNTSSRSLSNNSNTIEFP